MKKYSRVSYAVRCQIGAFLQAKVSVPEIAKRTGHHKSTIYREIKRNSRATFYGGFYNCNNAQLFAAKRYKKCRRKTIIRGRVEKIVQSALKEGWSPEQVAGRLRREKVVRISHESIYRYTRNHAQWARCLRFHGRRGYGRYRQKMARPAWMISIKERPQIVNERKRIGDWERDTMYVKDRKTILVLTDRKTRYTKLAPLYNHHSKEVAMKTKELIKATGKKAFTVTNDNGGEFRWDGQIGLKVYFCEAHKPQQRGTVENTIGTLRRYVKRNTELESVNIERLEKIINLKPRKVLNYLTPYEVYFNKKVALAM